MRQSAPLGAARPPAHTSSLPCSNAPPCMMLQLKQPRSDAPAAPAPWPPAGWPAACPERPGRPPARCRSLRGVGGKDGAISLCSKLGMHLLAARPHAAALCSSGRGQTDGPLMFGTVNARPGRPPLCCRPWQGGGGSGADGSTCRVVPHTNNKWGRDARLHLGRAQKRYLHYS